MDVHRCRFVPFPSSAINALAFSHQSIPGFKGKEPATLRLAIGRANGDVEIWNPLEGTWVQEYILRGGKDRSIEGLVWTQDPEEDIGNGLRGPGKLRLFSIGYSASVTEWDLTSGRPSRHSGGNHGEVWCIASQPRRQLSQTLPAEIPNGHAQSGASVAQSIVIGCADGTLVLYSTADDDLRYHRIVGRTSKRKSRVLSITFQTQFRVVAGYADSTIRIFDVRNGEQISQVSLGGGPKDAPKAVLIWSVKCLVDGTIVSGDSTGTVSFFDGKNYTLLQRIKSHNADVLDVASSVHGNTVFSGGMDRRTTIFRQMGGDNQSHRRRWVEIAHRRHHTHDVKALATFESEKLSVLVSGGLDTAPIVTPIKEFGSENHRTLPGLPSQPQLQIAPTRRLMMSWWNREIFIWRILKRPPRSHEVAKMHSTSESKSQKLVAKIVLQGDENLTSASISASGTMLAVSTSCSIKLFRLRRRTGVYNGVLKVQSMDVPKAFGISGAKTIQFSPDCKWLAVVQADNYVRIHRVVSAVADDVNLGGELELKRLNRGSNAKTLHQGSLGDYDRSITRISFSGDSRILVTADLSGFLDSWILEGHEELTQGPDKDTKNAKSSESSDSSDYEGQQESNSVGIFGQRWRSNPAAALLPKLKNAPLILSFRPTRSFPLLAIKEGNRKGSPIHQNTHQKSHDLPNSTDLLFVLTTTHSMYEFEVMSGRMSNWSRRNPTSNLPTSFRELRDRAMGLVWNIDRDSTRVWLYGISWLWMFDLSIDLPTPAKHESAKKEGDVSGNDDRPVVDGNDRNKRTRKRRREVRDQITKVLRRQDTGAGSRIPDEKLTSGIGRTVRKLGSLVDGENQWVSLEKEASPISEIEDGEMIDHTVLLKLRRNRVNNDMVDSDDEVGEVEDMRRPDGACQPSKEQHLARQSNITIPYWHTFKYRPIFGIVALGEEDGDADGDTRPNNDGALLHGGLEVALVERPMWDVDLPPRYYGDQEWDK